MDILKALPQVETIVINQFSQSSSEFGLLVSSLNQDKLGFNSQGIPRLQFVQDARAYGPWPRDQVLVDTDGRLIVSASKHHELRETFLSLDELNDISVQKSSMSFIGAQFLVAGNRLLCPENMDIDSAIGHRSVRVPAPSLNDFHLDLLVMPLSENVIAVGDVEMTRHLLLKLDRSEQKKLIARWAVEFAVSAGNIDLKWEGNSFSYRKLNKPGLIQPQMLEDKLAILSELLQPGEFTKAVLSEPAFGWDDRIAETLKDEGFEVVRIPFWRGRYGRETGKKKHGLPMLCYPNCLVWNEGILMPVYGIKHIDQLSQNVLASASGKSVFPVKGSAILGYGYSGPHCITIGFRK
ncbi:hypothetical protein GF337_13245 [candidate division KSB1 bacterium]|nr:hypothetical protein [candidate division KSB1 bacterium]